MLREILGQGSDGSKLWLLSDLDKNEIKKIQFESFPIQNGLDIFA